VVRIEKNFLSCLVSVDQGPVEALAGRAAERGERPRGRQ
jgi:hypothetical protein